MLRLADVEDDGQDAPPLPRPAAIHCHAWISRPTAAALACLHLRGLPPKVLGPTLLRLRPKACPNRRLAALLDQALGLPGVFAAAAALHRPLAAA